MIHAATITGFSNEFQQIKLAQMSKEAVDPASVKAILKRLKSGRSGGATFRQRMGMKPAQISKPQSQGLVAPPKSITVGGASGR